MSSVKFVDNKKMRYESIDGLRAFGSIGIILMHVKANGNYNINGFVYDEIIYRFGYFAFMFMVISAFSMCCGYYDRITSGTISLEAFYSKRYKRIWPYFALLVLFDFVTVPGMETLIETFANLTLCFSLLPNANMSVIGVAWTLGIIFVFYLLFPFFCYLLSKTKRAWMAFGTTIAIHFMCIYYFFDKNHVSNSFDADTNIMYCAVYFFVGGMIYLYRDSIVKFFSKRRRISLIGVSMAFVFAYVFVGNESISCIIAFSLLLSYAISSNGVILNNKFTKFISGISMEIYLCHMMVFRILEKMHLTKIVGDGLVSYVVTSLMVIIGSVVFAVVVSKIIQEVQHRWRIK